MNGNSNSRAILSCGYQPAFERGRLYPDLLPNMYMKDAKNNPFIIRMQEDDAKWAAINLKTGNRIGWKNIYDFEEEIFQLAFVIISKEEAFALI